MFCVGVHKCFVCDKSDSKPVQCAAPNCGKFYHTACAESLPHAHFEKGKLTCPLHVCATCVYKDKDVKDTKEVKGQNM